MTQPHPSSQPLEPQITDLRERMEAAEEALRAIRSGEVDALVIETEQGPRVYTLQDSEQAYRVMVETMNEGAATLLADGTVLYGNRRLAEMLGVPLEQILGASFSSFVCPSERGQFADLLAQAVSGEARAELTLSAAGACTLPALLSLKAIPIEGQHPAACLIVTGLAEQRRSRAELEARVAERTAELAQKNRDLEDFASIISHDLQEPLRKVRAFGDLLVEEAAGHLDLTELDYIRRMQEASVRMASMIDGLLALSRVSTRAIQHQSVDLNQVVQGALAALEISLERSQGQVEIEALPIIEAEPLQMQQLFQNLLGNALKFHRPDRPPHVRVCSRAANNGESSIPRVQILVEDNGIGFEDAYAEKLFQPFKRLVSRQDYDGTGMGLAICKRIVERHGGQIGVHSIPGDGATFWVTLPVRQL